MKRLSLLAAFWLISAAPAAHAQVSVVCGGADDTAALDTALAAATAQQTSVDLPGGTCARSTTWVLPNIAAINGKGRYKSTLKCLAGSGVCISAPNAPAGITLRNFQVSAPGMVGVQIGDSTHAGDHSLIENMAFGASTYALQLWNCSACRVLNSDWLAGFTAGAILIAEPLNPDAGDSLIDGNWIIGSSSDPTGPIGIQHLSGGGWKFSHNKIVTTLRAYWGFYGLGSHAISSLIITDNSFEGCGQDCIALMRQAGSTGPMLHVVIGNNQMSAVRGSGVMIPDDGTPWVQHLSLTGNMVNNVNASTCMTIGSTTSFVVSGDECGEHGAPSGPAIVIGPSSSSGIVGPVAVTGYQTKIVNSGANVALGLIGP